MKQILTPDNVDMFIGKTISWSVERSSDNAEYGPYTGEAVIRSYNPADHSHPLDVEQVSGDLFTAWQEGNEFFSGGDYTYIKVEVVENDPDPVPANVRREFIVVREVATSPCMQGRTSTRYFSGIRALKRALGRITGEDGREIENFSSADTEFLSPLYGGVKFNASIAYIESNEQDSML